MREFAGAVRRGGFVVERGPVRLRPPAVVDLPLPAGRDTDYAAWRQAALDALLSRKLRPFAGPVEVSLTFHDGRSRRLIGDLPNACLQLLIAARLIGSADSSVLRRVSAGWGEAGGVRIEIHAVDGRGA